MNKDKLSQFYIKIHDPKILINSLELCDFNILESRLENGHNISTAEIILKCKGVVDSKLELIVNSI